MPLRYLDRLGVNEAWTVVLINIPAALIMTVVLMWTRPAIRPHLRSALWIGIFTGATVAFFTIGLVYSSVVRVTLLFYLTPVWSTLIGMMFLGEPPTRGRWIAIGVGLVGLGFLVSNGGGNIPLNIGDALALISGVTWAIGGSLIKKFDDAPMPLLTVLQFSFAAMCAVLLGLALMEMPLPNAALLTKVAPFAVMVSFVFVLPTMLIIFWAQKFLFPGRVGLLMMSEVLVAVLSASLLLPEEALGAIEWLGAALIMGACLVEIFGASDAEPG